MVLGGEWEALTPQYHCPGVGGTEKGGTPPLPPVGPGT
jgi:hypothetical protein